MKKLLTVCCALTACVMFSSNTVWDAAKQVNLGQDNNKMTWYILDYGKNWSGVPYVIARKYYTNAAIKNDTIKLLMSKFGLQPEVAQITQQAKAFCIQKHHHQQNASSEQTLKAIHSLNHGQIRSSTRPKI